MKRVSFSECPVMTATFAAHKEAVRNRGLYDDAILSRSELESRICELVEDLSQKHGLEPHETDSLLVSTRWAARLDEIAA